MDTLSKNYISKQLLEHGKISPLEYFLTFLFVVCCGFTSGDVIPGKSYIIIFFGLIFMLKHSKEFASKWFTLFMMIIPMFLILLVHKKMFGKWDTSLKICMQLSIAGFFLIVMLKEKFKKAYFNIMTFICIISLFFYALMVLANYVPNIESLNTGSIYKGIFIWNARLGEIENKRNCGPFWEPGAFAGYILMVFILYFNEWRYIWTFHRKKTIVLLLALITTFSSQGYISAFLLVGAHLLKTVSHRDLVKFTIASIVSISLILVLYNSLPFLKEKVEEQLELTESWDSDQSLQSANRFTTTMVDIYNIQKRPLTGSSSDSYILYADFPFIINVVNQAGGYGSGSGMTVYMAQHGLVIFLIWLIMTLKSLILYYGRKRTAILVILVLLALGQGEFYITYIMYQSLPYLKFAKK